MARLPGENPEAQKRTLIGSALSFEFPECSIVAADLCKIAGELIANAHKHSKQELGYVIRDDDLPKSIVYQSVNNYGPEFSLDGKPTRLVLAQQVGTRRKKAIIENQNCQFYPVYHALNECKD